MPIDFENRQRNVNQEDVEKTWGYSAFIPKDTAAKVEKITHIKGVKQLQPISLNNKFSMERTSRFNCL